MPDPGNLDETVSGVRDGDLVDLLARVESASGADRRLELDLHDQLLGRLHREPFAPEDGSRIPPYTASLDASLGLVERLLPGAGWLCGLSGDGRYMAELFRSRFISGVIPRLGYATAPTPALALLAALLKALIAQAADTSARNVPAREGASNANPSPLDAARHSSDANAEPSGKENL